jgi:2-oxoisovalerate dehydrogenase E2 component (dihydrolipoyl transacylase)
MNLSISVDHRVVDGYDAARFVGAIKEGLEAPTGLWQGKGTV